MSRRAERKVFHPGRLDIGPRLLVGGALIILSMFAADAVVLWQFQVLRAHAGRQNDIDRTLIAVQHAHTSLLAFHDQLDALADAEDADRLVAEAGPLRTAVLGDIRRAMTALGRQPLAARRDPTTQSTLQVVQSALPSQLDAIVTLAAAGDWRAVHLRLANQIRPLEALTSALVEKMEHEVSAEQVQTESSMQRVQRRVFLIVPATIVLTLLLAGSIGLAITRSITRPLDRLVEGSKALARGEFEHEVAISGDDELARVGRVFNDTARRLQDLYATLQRSEDQLRLVIDTIPAHVWSTRPDGSVDFINRRWLESTGLPVERGLGWDWGSIVHPEDLPRFVDAWAAALAAGAPMEAEARLRRPDGEHRWWLIRNVPLRDEHHVIVKWYGTAIDIEERRRAEEALRQAKADLAHVSRVTTMGELTASIAHDVKQPITAAITNANACVRWLAHTPPDIGEARAAAMQIVEDGRRATDIISRTRLLFTRGQPQRELVDVNDLIREMIVLLRSEAARYDISVSTALAADLPPIMGDRVQLQQVLMNLIMNSIDAMSGVEEPRTLTITSQRAEGEQLLVCVSDTGVGLPPLPADRIFEAFVTTKAHGLGMGLSISRSIVESHGGQLRASDRPPRGASLFLTLPTRAGEV